MTGAGWTRRRVLTLALAPAAVLAGAGLAGTELVSRGILPGRSMLSRARRRVLGAGPSAGLLAPRSVVLGYVLLRGPAPDGRVHDRLSARPPPRRRTAAGGHAARLRGDPRRRPGRDVARAGAGAEGRRPAAGSAGDGHRRRRRWLLEPAPRRQPDGDGDRRADPALPAHRPRSPAPADRHAGHLDGRLRGAAVRREVPAPDRRGGRDQPGHLDQLPAGQAGQSRRVRVAAAFAAKQRGHARRRARPPPGTDRVGLRRSLLPGRPGARPALSRLMGARP